MRAPAGGGASSVRPLHRSSGPPLWQQLTEDLRRRLDRGEFAHTFPGELDLAAQYAVSRHTVREALRHLRDEGLVVVSRGRRPQPSTPATVTEQPTGIAYSLFSSVESHGMEQRSVVRTLDVRADGVVAPRLSLEESTPLLYLERLRLADDQPLALDRVWMPASLAEPLLDLDFTRSSLYGQLLSTTGIPVTGGEETVRAVIPSTAEHALLGLTPPTAAFSVERTGSSHGVPIEWRTTLIRADRFVLTSALATPDAPAAHHLAAAPVTLTPAYS